VTTVGRPTVSSHPSRRIVSTSTAKASSPRRADKTLTVVYPEADRHGDAESAPLEREETDDVRSVGEHGDTGIGAEAIEAIANSGHKNGLARDSVLRCMECHAVISSGPSSLGRAIEICT
jgi:hypothetical protein